ncbi:MAG TPA: hypothetical protein VMS64_37780 [Candidatus Methylomirabilis sp.]|nr:hypothetical protein [Candidatus Methylomirabilis sp.]
MNQSTVHFVVLVLAASSLLIATASRADAGAGALPDGTPWVGAIRTMDDALARGDLRAALRAREDARLAALASQRWEGMAMVGDATLRLAQKAGLVSAMEPAARRAYAFALHRASRQGSVDGAVRITVAFAGLGDHEMARKSLAVAESLAAACHDPDAQQRVRALEQWLAAEMPRAGSVPAAEAASREGTSPGRD